MAQADAVRQLKSAMAPKDEVATAVKQLLALKVLGNELDQLEGWHAQLIEVSYKMVVRNKALNKIILC